MLFLTTWFILPIAFILDMILGDPVLLPHPVRLMGNAISFFEKQFRKLHMNTVLDGFFFAIFMIVTTWIITFFLIKVFYAIHPAAGIILEIILVYYSISAYSLKKAAMEVKELLEKNNIPEARKKLSFIVGREVDKLTDEGIARATVETVAENLVDGVISPLFFAAVGGAPLAMSYKMINTLDSMVGYKNETYIDFGKIAAKIDDVANYLPARISVVLIVISVFLFSKKKSRNALKTAVKEGRAHSSPNAGFPEAAFAGALGVKLGGPNYYHGTLVSKLYIGVNFGSVSIDHIKKACDIMLISSFIWVIILWGLYIIKAII